MKLVNNELQNASPPVPPTELPEGRLDPESAYTGRLSFMCSSTEHFGLVETHLTSRRASAILTDEGGRIYLRALGAMERPALFPTSLVVPVEVVDDAGPAVL